MMIDALALGLSRADTDVLVRYDEGCRMLGLSPRAGERLLRDPRSDFPRPFKTGGRQRFFRLADLQAHIQRRALAAQRPSDDRVAALGENGTATHS